MSNVYFDLTRELNASRRIAVLTSGQAVVYYRIAMMSKDGDWILRESPEACFTVLDVLGRKDANYRHGAPLDVRWLAGGWSSHFEFRDEKGRRVRCDFLSRPPRVSAATIDALFAGAAPPKDLTVLDLESLIRMKQTQRAKDYPIIGELARRLPPEREVELTTDPDRILELASHHGRRSNRPSIRAALGGGSREEVVVELARELDRLQQEDRLRLERYEEASRGYLEAFRAAGIPRMPLARAHAEAVRLAEKLLPARPPGNSEGAP